MIHINERFAIRSDNDQLVLIERVKRTRKEDSKPDCRGEPYKAGDAYVSETILGYHTAVSHALTALRRRLRRELIQSTDMTLYEALDAFTRLDRDFRAWARQFDADEVC